MTTTLREPATHWAGLGDVPWSWGRSIVTLGVFDGMHRGHRRLLDRAVELGERRGLPVVLVTFDPHPATVAGPARDTSALATVERRAELAREHGADAVLVLPFDDVPARTSAVEFALDVLVRALRATDVVVGEDFRFGHRGAGDVTLLRRLGARHGFTAHGVELLAGCSSTQVRALLSAGDVAGAARVLGRFHRSTGVVRVEPRSGEVSRAQGVVPGEGHYRVLLDGVRDGVARVDAAGRLFVEPGPASGTVTVDYVERM
ncbi:MAG: riboflavin kinase / adenylyltransferase [Pseudonocardiales bacterium]|nr:riboflavin kinase / adenylyltransferase [Pseudonocardiales bacterium]